MSNKKQINKQLIIILLSILFSWYWGYYRDNLNYFYLWLYSLLAMIVYAGLLFFYAKNLYLVAVNKIFKYFTLLYIIFLLIPFFNTVYRELHFGILNLGFVNYFKIGLIDNLKIILNLILFYLPNFFIVILLAWLYQINKNLKTHKQVLD